MPPVKNGTTYCFLRNFHEDADAENGSKLTAGENLPPTAKARARSGK